MFELEAVGRLVAKIKVIGVGGGGGNAINSMIAANLFGVEFIAVNTDSQHLDASLATTKVQIGTVLSKGLGAGSNPEVGRQAALDDRDALIESIEGTDMVFITAGMGGGTGTGAAPVIAAIAKELGILTVGVVTKPFYYEGRKRALNAEKGIKELKDHVDTLIVIPNDRIHLVVEKGTPLLKSFAIANDVLRQAIQGISDLILKPGLINLDFADVRAIMEKAGKAVIGIGTGSGAAGAFDAAKRAISNPLLEESSIEGAKRILINITGGLHLSLDSIQEVASLIHESAHDEVNIILGAVINPDMEEEVSVTVIATELEERIEKAVLPGVRPWSPKKEPMRLKGSGGFLSKNMDAGTVRMKEPDSSGDVFKKTVAQPVSETVFDMEQPVEQPAQQNSQQPVEDIYDIPTFLRKQT